MVISNQITAITQASSDCVGAIFLEEDLLLSPTTPHFQEFFPLTSTVYSFQPKTTTILKHVVGFLRRHWEVGRWFVNL